MAAPNLTDHRLVELEAQPTLAVRIRRPMSEVDIGALFDEYLPKVNEHATAHGLSPAGPPFARYHQFGPDVADVEIGVPLADARADLARLEAVPLEQIGRSELPGGLTAVVTHHGRYNQLGDAYSVLHDWIHSQGHDEGPGPWESYIEDPETLADPDLVRTEIFWPTE
jgi:effector-binding domain-containing protein